MTVDTLARVRFGLHSNAADFTSTPGTLNVIELRNADGLQPRERLPIARQRHSADNMRYASVNGVKDLAPITLPMDFRGVDSNTGGASTWQNKMEQALLLDSIFGAAAAASASAAPTVVSGSASALEASTNVIATGDMIMIPTSVGNEVREVTAGGGSVNLTLDRDLEGAATAAGTIIRLGRWNLAPSTSKHTPGYIEAEWVDGDDVALAYFGCTPESFELNFPAGDIVEMVSTWLPNDWDEIAAANPSYAAPVAGSPIVAANARLWIASSLFPAEDLKLSIKHTTRVRKTTQGVNGQLGVSVTNKHEVVLSGRLYAGDNASSLGEIRDNAGTPSHRALREAASVAGSLRTTRDIAYQCGTAAGGLVYMRMPAADFTSKIVQSDGIHMLDFQARATRPSSGSPFRLGVG